MLKTLAIVLGMTLLPAAAMAQQGEQLATAATLKSGQYKILCGVDGRTLKPNCKNTELLQTICIKDNNTWYGTTFPNWGGDILVLRGRQTIFEAIFGNYLSGFGNSSFAVIRTTRAGATADWTEWRDDLSFKNFLPSVQLIFQKTKCDPPATGALAPLGDPSGPNEQ
jgi:hypothetical protein